MPANAYGQLAQGGPPPGPMPPAGAPPGGSPGGQLQGAAPADPVLVDALNLLSGHDGPIADVLKDPVMHDKVQALLAAVKQDPQALQALAAKGIGAPQIQQFEQLLQKEKAAHQPAPHWLRR